MKPIMKVALSKARFRHFARLHQKKFRDLEGLFLAEGLRTVKELCLNLPHEEMLLALLVREGEGESARFAEAWAEKLFTITEKESALLAGTSTPQGIFGVFRQPQHKPELAEKPGRSLIVVLDDLQDPGNVGTILRTAVWFGADAMICSAGTADRYNPKVIRSCAGSIFALRHYGVQQLHQELLRLQKIGYTIVCSTLEGNDFREVEAWPQKIALVIGNEANGISIPIKALAELHLRIPHAAGQAKVESLNASISAAIFMERMMLG